MITIIATAALVTSPDATPREGQGRDISVTKSGRDSHPGTKQQPHLTISAAAKIAQPGDRVRV